MIQRVTQGIRISVNAFFLKGPTSKTTVCTIHLAIAYLYPIEEKTRFSFNLDIGKFLTP